MPHPFADRLPPAKQVAARLNARKPFYLSALAACVIVSNEAFFPWLAAVPPSVQDTVWDVASRIEGMAPYERVPRGESIGTKAIPGYAWPKVELPAGRQPDSV